MALTTKPTYPTVAVSSNTRTDIPGNDSKHNFPDPNGGGGPRHMPKKIPHKQRGGVGQHGQKVYGHASMGGGRSGTGNPASRSGSVGNFPSESRIPGHGGSPQHRGNMPTGPRGGFGQQEQNRVSAVPHANPTPGPGNTSGTAYKRIAGRFNRKSMGASGNQESSGSYGGAPVTSNT